MAFLKRALELEFFPELFEVRTTLRPHGGVITSYSIHYTKLYDFAGGMMRFAYDSVDDLKLLMDLSDEEVKNTDWDTNTTEQFYDDLYQVTAFRTDPQLSEIMITKSLEAMIWLRQQGVRFVPNYRAASAVVEGRRVFFGRMPVEVAGGGPGLVQYLDDAAIKKGVEIFYETRAVSLIYSYNFV